MKTTLLAALSLGAIAATASGALVSIEDQDIPIPTTFEGVYVDLESGATGAAPFAGADINFFFGGAGIGNDADDSAVAPTLQFLRVGPGNLDAARRSRGNDVISGASSTFSTGFGGSGDPNGHIGPASNQFQDGELAYLGFSLDQSGSGGSLVYGYFDVTLTSNGAGVIHSWYIEDSGGPIVVVPEPASVMLSVLGLAAVTFRRRR